MPMVRPCGQPNSKPYTYASQLMVYAVYSLFETMPLKGQLACGQANATGLHHYFAAVQEQAAVLIVPHKGGSIFPLLLRALASSTCSSPSKIVFFGQSFIFASRYFADGSAISSFLSGLKMLPCRRCRCLFTATFTGNRPNCLILPVTVTV